MNARIIRSLFLAAFPLLWAAVPITAGRAATLTGTFSPIAAGSNVDLTVAGKLDWVHWGLYTANSLNRKASVTPQISNFTLVGDNSTYSLTAYQYGDNSNSYSWFDGYPVASVSATTTGVWAYDYIPIGSGFQLTVPASTKTNTFEVFVGAYAAQGRFTASLSDRSAPDFTNSPGATVNNIGNGPGGVFSINYAAASSNQMLTVRWTVASAHGLNANVTLQAAALTAPNADNPPYIIITNPVSNTAFSQPADVTIQAMAEDFDGTVTNVSFYAGTNELGHVPGNSSKSYSFTWTNPPRGYYVLSARATDNGGATGYAQPVEAFVYGTGGAQTDSATTSPAAVDLTTEGTADWVHWGYGTNDLFDRKALVAPQISDFVELETNTFQQYTDNYTAFSWSDGTPDLAVSGTTTGVFFTNINNGFRLTVPADTYPRQLRLYVGGYGVQAQFQAYLSDLSAPPYIDTSSVSNVYGNSYVLYTINYAAATNNQQLIVVYRSAQLFDQTYGNVTLQAATLQATGPIPVKILNPQLSGGDITFSFLSQAGRTYTVQDTYSLDPPLWQTLDSFPGDGTVMSVTNPAPANSNCFYRVLTQ